MKGKVLLAMSGGIDSSVAAILLLKQGYQVAGVTYRVWDYISESCIAKETGCCSVENIYEAKRMAEKLGFEHQIVDFRSQFKDTIIQNFIDEYSNGRTPNPCVLCNAVIKWGDLMKVADELGCQYIATGHYAQIKEKDGRYFLAKGLDDTKDQSYFLWMLTQENLKRTLFPLGQYTKTRVREIALEQGFEKLSKKSESQEICFIPDDDYRRFLKEQIPDFEKKFKPGFFESTDGKLLGKHQGLPFYTIGQRKGLQVAAGYPLFVAGFKKEQNTIILGRDVDLMHRKIKLGQVNLMKFSELSEPIEVTAKIRYRNTGNSGLLKQNDECFEVEFLQPVSSATPGQSGVFYQGDDVVGGGIIQEVVE